MESTSAAEDREQALTRALTEARARAELAERALEESERRKDELLAVLAHELRNPLAPVLNGVEILRRSAAVGPDQAKVCEIVARQVSHMSRMIDDLLDVSRISRGKIRLKRERLDVVRIVRSVLDDYRAVLAQGGLALRMDLLDGPLWIEGDDTRVAQMIGNILHNAVKFTDPGGTVDVMLAVDDGHAVISVRDDGLGIKPEMLPRLFEPFHQDERTLARTRGGLGLGLALVRGLVELHGGTCAAKSDGAGRGTEVTLRFPLAKQPIDGMADLRGTDGARGLRVLIIEDNTDAAETLATLLELLGHEVTVAHDGHAGLSHLPQARPDLVLCDIGLPGGLDGYQIARTIRADASHHATYLVALTGYGRDEDRAEARKAGFDLHVTKPIAPSVLEDALRAARRV